MEVEELNRKQHRLATTMTSPFVMLLVMTIVVTEAAHPPKWHELGPTYTFGQYKKDFNKNYVNKGEEEMRRSLFQSRLRSILDHNSQQASLFHTDPHERKHITPVAA